jgi:hypothetical protein
LAFPVFATILLKNTVKSQKDDDCVNVIATILFTNPIIEGFDDDILKYELRMNGSATEMKFRHKKIQGGCKIFTFDITLEFTSTWNFDIFHVKVDRLSIKLELSSYTLEISPSNGSSLKKFLLRPLLCVSWANMEDCDFITVKDGAFNYDDLCSLFFRYPTVVPKIEEFKEAEHFKVQSGKKANYIPGFF